MKLEVQKRLAKKKVSVHPLLFIHGAAGGAWYFEHFLNYFALEGYDSYALSLRGHGNSEGKDDIDTYSMDDYVLDVRSIVQTFKEKPILIGHSMGGAITQRYINQYVDEIHQVILLASAEAGGIDKNSPLGLFFNDAISFLRNMRTLYPDQKITIDGLLNQTVFSNRFKEEELKIIKSKLTKESQRVKKDLLLPFIEDYDRIKIPVVVIGSRNDHIVTLEQTYKTAKAFHVEPVLIDDLCHFMTIDPDWMKAAEAIKNAIIK